MFGGGCRRACPRRSTAQQARHFRSGVGDFRRQIRLTTNRIAIRDLGGPPRFARQNAALDNGRHDGNERSTGTLLVRVAGGPRVDQEGEWNEAGKE